MRKLFLFVFLLILLATGLLHFKIEIIERTASWWLSRQGYKDVQLTIEKISSTELRLTHFTIRSPPEKGDIKIDLRDIHFGYQLQSLFQKKLKSCQINQATLYISTPLAKNHDTTASFSSKKLIEILNKLQVTTLPVTTFAVRRLYIQSPLFSNLNESPIACSLNNTPQMLTIHSKGHYSGNILHDLFLQRELNAPLKAKLSLYTPANNSLLELEAQGTSDSIILAGKTNVNILERLPALTGNFNYTGTFTLSAKIDLRDNWPFEIQVESRNLSSPWMKISRGGLNLTGSLHQALTLQLDSPSAFLLEGIESDMINAQSIHGDLLGKFAFHGFGWDVTDTSSSPWIAQALHLGSLRIEQTELRLPETISKSAASYTFFYPKQLQVLQLEHIDAGPITLPALTLFSENKNQFLIRENQGEINCILPPLISSSYRINFNSGNLTAEATQISSSKLNLKKNNTSIHTSLYSDGIKLNLTGTEISLEDLKGSFSLQKGQIQSMLEGKSSLLQSALNLKINHNINQSKGHLKLATSTPLILSDNYSLASLYTKPLPFNITEGKTDFSSSLQWQHNQPAILTTKFKLTDGSGSAYGLPFSGLQLNTSLNLLPELASSRPVTFSIDTIDAAVAINNITGNCNILPSPRGKMPVLDISKLQSKVFKGKISLEPTSLDLNKDIQEIKVDMAEIDLPSIIELFKYDELKVQGTLEGSLPISWDNNGLSITDGLIKGTDKGGSIYFTPANMGQQANMTEYALKALKEFNYTLLEAPLSYQPDGTLLADIHLQGKSPGISATRPVHLNLHTEQNLLSLLASLRYSTRVSKQLDKKIQNQ